MNVTVVITCKDRVKNLELCLASLHACNLRPFCVLVDFGNATPLEYPQYAEWLKVIRVTRNTEIFHKARAINIGLKAVQTSFSCITDADQIFQPDFFNFAKGVLGRYPDSFVMCKTYFLQRFPSGVIFDSAGKAYAKLLKEATENGIARHGDGCCNGVLTKFALDIHGYDESYVGYRAQDSDFALRAIYGGLKKVWIHDKTSMIHLPHQRQGEYYDASYRNKNREKYFAKVKEKHAKIIVANKDTPWGEI